jgi:transcriptional regulator with XRE-family HTH domain
LEKTQVGQNDLRSARKQHAWNQQELARRLGVSQTLVSLWEHGKRRPPAKRVEQLRKFGVKVHPTLLPMRTFPASVDFAQELANLGYPGFAHFAKGEPELNPAQLLVFALSQAYLDRRTAEALPWVASRYYDMDWDWVRLESKQRDLQNRLGFTLSVAKNLVSRKNQPEAAQALESQEQKLRESLLVKEDTYCNDRMTTAERRWLRTHRSPEAAAWHVLSDLMPEHVTHA